MSIRDEVEAAPGRDKFIVLANALDNLAGQVKQGPTPVTVAEEVDVIPIAELAEEFGCSPRVLMQNLRKSLGDSVILRIGNHYYIRKVRWRDYLVKMEAE